MGNDWLTIEELKGKTKDESIEKVKDKKKKKALIPDNVYDFFHEAGKRSLIK